MPLFTFFFEYQGGTYISQVHARSYRTAPKVWAEKLDLTQIPNAERHLKEKLLKSLELLTLVPTDGVTKTWCCDFLYTKGTTVHFTQTVE